MTGSEYPTLAEEINGGDAIGEATLYVLLNIARSIVEQMRDWVRLRATDTSISVTSSNTWQTAISLAGITRFSRFYGDNPICLFDGNNRTEYYHMVPWVDRLQYRQANNTFVYDAANNTIYLNGTVPYSGTLYVNHMKYGADIANDDNSWGFPSYAHPLLAFLAVGIHKGGIDYDDINARMSGDNRSVAQSIMSRLVAEDAKMQEQEISQYDPHGGTDEWRNGAINIHN